METLVRVREAMTSTVVTVTTATPVNEAAQLMAGKNIGSIVIVDNGKPIGMVTERDLAFGVVAKDQKPSEVLVKDIMSSPIIFIDPDADMTDAARRMAKNNIRRLPVIKDDELIGILSTRDIMAINPERITILEELAKMVCEEEGAPRVVPERGTCENCRDYGVGLSEVDGTFLCESCKEDRQSGD